MAVHSYRVNSLEHEPRTNLIIGNGQTSHRKQLLGRYYNDPKIPRVSQSLVDLIFSLKSQCAYSEEYHYDDYETPIFDSELPSSREIQLRINGSPYIVMEAQMLAPDPLGIFRRGFITRHLRRSKNGASVPLSIQISYVVDDDDMYIMKNVKNKNDHN